MYGSWINCSSSWFWWTKVKCNKKYSNVIVKGSSAFSEIYTSKIKVKEELKKNITWLRTIDIVNKIYC